MKVLVTGAAGFVGSRLAKALLARGDTVTGLDNFDPFYDPALKEGNVAALGRQAGFSLVRGDIRDAVLREFKVRDTDYQYRYTVACDTGPAFQFADTIEEIWAKLYRARGRVMIKDATVTSDDTSTSWIFHGTPEEARAWCLAQQG